MQDTEQAVEASSGPAGSASRASDILQAIQGRRSVARVKSEQPPRELVERILEAAVCAPNHYRTEPWRFFVLTGDARNALGEVMAQSLRNHVGETSPTALAGMLEKERSKPLRAPVIIAAAAVPSDEAHVIEIEEIAATAAAIENMLLAAHALGLGAKWRTGAPASDPEVKRWLGLPERSHLLAFVYLGYPDMPERSDCTRSPIRRTTWLGWDESE